MEFKLRRAVPDDAPSMGNICHRAFLHFNLSVGIPVYIDALCAENSQVGDDDDESMVNFMKHALTESSTYGLVAVSESSGQILGGSLLHYFGEGVHSIGPVFVDPLNSNHGVGTAIVAAIRDHALHVDNASSIRLVQVAHNTKSFCLYAKLGFNPVEIMSYFQGRLDGNKEHAACEQLGIHTLNDVQVLPMRESDVFACASLFERTMGYCRESEIRHALADQPSHAWVAVKKEADVLMAFTTGFTMFGFSVSINEESLVMLYRHVSNESSALDPAVQIPSYLHPKLVRWAVSSGLKLIRHQWLMVHGSYDRPDANLVYCPGILH